jgi:hypothetical protein
MYTPRRLLVVLNYNVGLFNFLSLLKDFILE